MPDLPEQPRLPSGPPVPPDYFERFVEELEGIRRAIEVTNNLIPKQAADTAKKLADFYDTGMSGRESRPSEPVPPSWSGQAVDLSELRRAQGDQGRSQASVPGRPQWSPTDEMDQDSGPSVPPPPAPLRGYKDWRDHVPDDLATQRVLSIPRSEGGHFTPTDLFNWLGNMATKQGVKMDERSDDGQGGERMGQAGYFLHRAAQYTPQVALLRQYASRFGIMSSPSGLEAAGASLNTSPSGSASAGPLGFRVPFFNAAARQGMSREFDIMKMRASGGVNGQQARFIYDQLNSRGFQEGSDFNGGLFSHGGPFEGGMSRSDLGAGSPTAIRQTPGFKDMAQSAKWMTQRHPQLVNEQYFTLLDKATRAGATSLDAFTRNMSDVADVAKNTGYSFQQLQADMDAVGQVNEEQGGTHAQGQVAAVRFQAQTKIPAALLPGLMNNPFVQTYAMRANNLMPWEQGLETGPQRAADVSGAVMQSYNAIGSLPAQKQKLAGGFERTISSEDRRLALLHTQFPEVPVDKLRQMVDSHKTIQARSTLEDITQQWSENVGKAKGGDRDSLFDPKRMQGGWGAIQKQMGLAGFSKKDMDSVRKAGSLDLGDDHVKELLKSGKTPEQIVATRRYTKIKDIIEKKGDKLKEESGPTVTIKLDDKARKKGFFFDNKDKARAGQTHVNVPFGLGPSEAPAGTP